MSLLSQLFNRGIFGSKCKTCLSLAISRFKLVQNKRDLQLRHMCKEIAQFLQAGQDPIARIRVEHVIREQNMHAAYEILELFCEFTLARVPIIESEKECPAEMREAIASIIYAAPKCVDVPDLQQLKSLFATKYGKEFTAAASELRPNSSVNRVIIEKLSVNAPSGEARIRALRQIALEYNLEWSSSVTETELFKSHEDLLSGSKKVAAEDIVVNEMEPSTSDCSKALEVDVCRPSDVLAEAKAALAYADRAVVMARAAAELAKLDTSSFNVAAKSS